MDFAFFGKQAGDALESVADTHEEDARVVRGRDIVVPDVSGEEGGLEFLYVEGIEARCGGSFVFGRGGDVFGNVHVDGAEVSGTGEREEVLRWVNLVLMSF